MENRNCGDAGLAYYSLYFRELVPGRLGMKHYLFVSKNLMLLGEVMTERLKVLLWHARPLRSVLSIYHDQQKGVAGTSPAGGSSLFRTCQKNVGPQQLMSLGDLGNLLHMYLLRRCILFWGYPSAKVGRIPQLSIEDRNSFSKSNLEFREGNGA